jgi:DNA-binding IclR family transcriptional regulator
MNRDVNPNHVSDLVQRTLDIAVLLAGNEFTGVTVTELSHATRLRSDTVVRSLANLVQAGWAEKMDTGRYRLAAKPVQIALAFSTALARAETEVADVRNRYTRQP